MPDVSPDTAPPEVDAVPTPSDPAARIRRLVASARDRSDADPAGPSAITAALARFDAPLDLRVRGGLGSGRRTLAAALRERRGWRAAVDDVDEVAAPGAPHRVPPDVEILCLRTAPCRHEEAWSRRARVHPLLVVATGVDDHEVRPRWATGLPAVDARRPDHPSVDAVVAFVDRAVDGLASVRSARLAAELERLAVRDDVADLAEAALCALGGVATGGRGMTAAGGSP